VTDSLAGLPFDEARRALARRLTAGGIDTPDLDARLLAGAALNLDLTGLIAQAARCLANDEAARLDAFARRRLAGEPVARILGVREFWSLSLRLSPETLVPRPETETVVEAVLDLVRAGRAGDRPLHIVDIGTGSGAILLALLHELPQAIGIGTDISIGALQTAGDNAQGLGLAGRAQFVACDCLAALNGPFDLIVSNPPYIPSGDIDGLAVEVREHDPRRALDGGADGLDVYRRITGQAAAFLVPDGALVVEIGQNQSADVLAMIEAGGLAPLPPRTDLSGIPRALIGRKLP
jgi:release factor glutamine methyltransferase